MGLGQLLHIIYPDHQRVVIVLGGADPQHMQDHLGVLGIVLVRAVVQGFAGASGRHR